jgi:3-oxoacyl-(acyl-carrier-protein) synthase
MRLASPLIFPHCYANATNSLISIEFGIRGYNLNFCGDWLCGGRSLEEGWRALRGGRADLMLAGGCDAVTDQLAASLKGENEGKRPAHDMADGACFLLLETEGSAERRAARPVCRVGSLATEPLGLPCTDANVHAERAQGAVRRSVQRAMDQAGRWDGDLGLVVRAGPRGEDAFLTQGVNSALDSFSQVPSLGIERDLGATFAAGFPLACAAAALVLQQGFLPVQTHLVNVTGGVEFWQEEDAPPLLGDSALVVGCTPHTSMAAVLCAV